jgi:hypothetical protein
MSTHRTLSIAALILSGCVPTPPPQPEPVSLGSTRSKADVVQIATRELTSAGFEISASDTAAGTLTARRVQEKRGNFDYISCKFAENSLAEMNLVSTLTVTVKATGSDVDIRSSVLSAYPGLADSPLPRSESQTDCASNGVIEKKLATALGKP